MCVYIYIYNSSTFPFHDFVSCFQNLLQDVSYRKYFWLSSIKSHLYSVSPEKILVLEGSSKRLIIII